MIAWFARHRGLIGVLIPYVAMCATFVVGLGVYKTQVEQAQLRSRQAALAADLAAERARDAEREASALAGAARQSCLDRQAARADVDEVLRTIGAALPPRVALQIAALLASRPPIDC